MKKTGRALMLAAILAAMASMTAFADGWSKDTNNQWVYYENGGRLTNAWKTGADGAYYYLGSNGYLQANSFVDDDRYVDGDGRMVTSAWRQIDSKWYYFDANGRMVKDRARQISDLWYYFDGDGAMRTGWVNDGDNWYYCDPNAGGRMVTSAWRQLVPDDEMVYGEESDGPETTDGSYWFYFMSTGKVARASGDGNYKELSIGDNRYAFDEFGRMQTGWVKLSDKNPAIAGYKYYNDTANIGTYGAAHAGWLSAYPPEDEDTDFGSDVQWYYFDAKGTPYYGTDVSNSDDDETLNAKFRRLQKNGKTQVYLFNEYGNPVYGLRKVRRSSGVITSMYFGTKEESSLQLGDRNIKDANGETSTFYFDGSGYGYNGIRDGKLYYMGKLQKATDDTYAFYPDPTNPTDRSKDLLVSKSGTLKKNYNKNKTDYVDYQSDANGRRGSYATADPEEWIEPAFVTSEY